MTEVDCVVIFNLQMEIIDAPDLSAGQKLKMLKNAINKTLATIDADE